VLAVKIFWRGEDVDAQGGFVAGPVDDRQELVGHQQGVDLLLDRGAGAQDPPVKSPPALTFDATGPLLPVITFRCPSAPPTDPRPTWSGVCIESMKRQPL
jgi:hypothetical protein